MKKKKYVSQLISSLLIFFFHFENIFGRYFAKILKVDPLGSWSDLKPNLGKQILAIIKARFLIKIRDKSAIIEIILSFCIMFLIAPTFFYTSTTYPLNKNPRIEEVTNQTLIDWFSDNNVIVGIIPDKPLMHYLIGNTSILKYAIEGGTIPNTNVTFPGSKFFYFNSTQKLNKELFKTNGNAVGFEWTNIDEGEESLQNPQIKISIQSIQSTQNINFFIELRNSIIEMKKLNNLSEKSDTLLSINTSLYRSEFAHPEVKRLSNVYSFTYGIISSLICIVISISDMELLFSDKQSRFLSFSILMGMSETAFWIANFFVSFVICLISYLFISLMLAFWFGLKGNDFSMIFVFSILYIIAELWFQFFLSTFINNTSGGRWMIISLIMIGVATGFLFQFVAFGKDSSNSNVVINMFRLFPFSVYQLFIMQGSFSIADNLPLYRWNNMKSSEYSCSPFHSFTMIIIDIFLYFILFLILNAFLPRQFGSQPFNIKECFNFSKKNKKKRDEIYETHGSDNSEIEYRETVIEVENLTKKFKGMKNSKALDNVSFTVKKGEVILVIGPNGAGKSTLINCLSNIIHSNEGIISINDNITKGKQSIGVCFQDDVLIKSLTVKHHFELFGSYRGIQLKTLEKSVNYLCSVLNLSNLLNRRSGTLSGGQKRKLCIALSLLGNPRVLLMDEPTTGVDVTGRLLIWNMISNLKETTSIIVSHELEEAEFISSRLFIMTDGKISFSGTSTELKQEYKCGYELRLDFQGGNADSVLKLAKEFVPDASFAEDRDDVIQIPDSIKISDFLFSLEDKKEELGIRSYTFTVEQFEDVLMNLVYK